MAEVWAEMQTQVEETSRRLLPLESSNHGSLGQDKHRPNYTYAGTYTITARLTECACRCKKEQHAERKPDKSQPPEWTGSVGIPVARSNQWEGGLQD